MINPEIKAKWVAALRSGRYQQTKYSLRRHSSFCCLGVLCDLHPDGKWEETAEGGNITDVRFTVNGEHQLQVLTLTVQDWAGLVGTNPDFLIKGTVDLTSLAELNDKGNKDFNQIADLIEEYL